VQIKELFHQGRPLISFEFFPPRTPEGEASLLRTIDALRPLRPSFVSVTRTGGKPREAPVAIVERIKGLGIEGAVHVTAIEASRDDIAEPTRPKRWVMTIGSATRRTLGKDHRLSHGTPARP